MSSNDSLESLLNKATSPLDNDSQDYIDDFCDKVKLEPEGAVISTRLLAHKIQSPQESEALKALQCLEACVKFCGEVFERELGKYRFLNELIKVVSPKYLGKQSSEKVQKKIVSMLFTWSCHFREQNKIRDAYQMLKKQGVVPVDPPFDHSLIMHVPPPRDEKNSIFNDTEKRKELDKLLKSQKPEDLQAANRLIKSVVQAEEAKMEKMKKRNEILEETSNNVRLLSDMLDCHDSNHSASTEASLQTMQMLYEQCQKLRPTLFRLASDTDDSEKALMDTLRANDDVSRVMQLFEKLINHSGAGGSTSTSQPHTSDMNDITNDLEFLSLTPPPTNDGLLLIEQPAPPQLPPHQTANNFNLFDLSNGQPPLTTASATTDLFKMTTLPPPHPQHPQNPTQQHNIITFHDVIKPSTTTAPTLSSTPPLLGDVIPNTSSQDPASSKTLPLSDIDQLSSGLIEMSLGRKPEGKFPMANSKPTLKELQENQLHNVKKQQQQQKTTAQILSGEVPADQILSIPVSVKPASGLSYLLTNNESSSQAESSTNEDWIVNIDKPLTTSTFDEPPVSSTNVAAAPLTDVYVNLESIRPSTFTPITIYDTDDVRLMIHFAKDHASLIRTDTLVSVVSIMSTKTSPLTQVTFQAAAPKVMRVKLQPPSSTTLQAYNPIISSPPITQVMIVANNSNKEVKLRYKLEYKTQNDDELTSYSGTITGFPARESWGKL